MRSGISCKGTRTRWLKDRKVTEERRRWEAREEVGEMCRSRKRSSCEEEKKDSCREGAVRTRMELGKRIKKVRAKSRASYVCRDVSRLRCLYDVRRLVSKVRMTSTEVKEALRHEVTASSSP